MRTVRLEAGGGDKEEMRGRGNGEKGLGSSAFGSVWGFESRLKGSQARSQNR